MGLYAKRLAELSEPSRRSRRVAGRQGVPTGERTPSGSSSHHRYPPSPVHVRRGPEPRRDDDPLHRRDDLPLGRRIEEGRRARPSMEVQSLLFDRAAGWTESKAKAWAKSHGYKYGNVDVTDQYVHLRQFSPEGLKVKRTITFGAGIRAVVARKGSSTSSTSRPREESMATTKKSARRSPRPRTKEAVATEAARKRRRRTREEAATEATPRRRRRVREAAPVAEARRPRRRRESPEGSSYMMEEARRRRRRARRTREEAWPGDKPGHSAAAKKGWRKRRRSGREESTVAYEARRPRGRRTREAAAEPMRTRRRYKRGMSEAKRGEAGGKGERMAELAIAVVSGGVGFLLADALDRFLATYDPSAATKPTDKFTSDGAGTLANTLNIASSPDVMRIGAGLGLLVAPAIGSVFVENPFVRASLEGLAVGAGVKLVGTFWDNVVMGSWLKPKDTSVASLQKSMIARLYPAEVAAAINLEQKQTTVASTGSGALSDAPAGNGSCNHGTVGAPSGATLQFTAGVGQADVGPFALSAESPYPDTVQALRRQAGVQDYPSVSNVWGTGWFPAGAQAIGTGAILDIAKEVSDQMAKAGAAVHPTAAIEVAQHAAAYPHDIMGGLQRVFPHMPILVIEHCARMLHPRVAKHAAAGAAPTATQHAAEAAQHAANAAQQASTAQQAAQQATTPAAQQVAQQAAATAAQHATQAAQQAATAQQAAQVATPAAQQVAEQAAGAAAQHATQAAQQAATAQQAAQVVTPAAQQAAQAMPTSTVSGLSQPPTWEPGPPPGVGPGPQVAPHAREEGCACLGDNNAFLGFIGDGEEDTLFNSGGKAA